MKVLQPSRLEDSFLFTSDGTLDLQASLKSTLAPFFEALETFAGEWMPEVVMGKRQRKYSRSSIWKSWEEEREGGASSIFFYRKQWPAVVVWPGVYFSSLPPELKVFIEVQPLSLFAEEARCARFVELVRAWATHYPVTHASAHSQADDQAAGAPDFGRDERIARRNGFDQIYEVSWLNVFGPRLVEAVGRERMLSTPAWRVEELPHGAVLVVLQPTAADYASEASRVAQARAHVHLRPDLDFDTVLRTLRERSAALAPVEPRFPPDVAPLCSRVVDDVALHLRQRKIAELNAWRPPEPEEWLPAEAALPLDVADPARELQRYSLLAEHLVALLHTKVPSVFDTSPESLTDVDYQFWHEEFPRVFERERIEALAVPAIGAYLGQVLVRHLGGQWIARRKLEEAQVRVGSRVWLPFVRAGRYMRSCPSLLDFSLSQLYRVAERHQG
jgi:hypothetical protein